MKINIREVFERMDDVEENDNVIMEKQEETDAEEETAADEETAEKEDADEGAADEAEPEVEAEEEPEVEEVSESEDEEVLGPEDEEVLGPEDEEVLESEESSELEADNLNGSLEVLLPKIKALWKLYGELCIIALAFVVILSFMFVYTTMIPREVSLTVDGETKKLITKDNTIAKMLETEGIEYCERDFLSVPATGFVSDGMKVKLRHATAVTIVADGERIKFKTLEKTVSKALIDAGIKVGEIDIVTPEVNCKIAPKMTITVQRVETKEKTINEKVPFAVVNQDDTSMNHGETKVVTKGVNGKDKVVYEITYIDGKEASRKELSREVIKPAIDEVVANGTRVVFNGKSYSRKLVVKAYSYTGGGRTAMGTQARVGEIAVDPRVIPLGSNVYIEGVGYRRAEDTGGNIKGNTIDIYMNTQSECIRWGVRYVTIYIE